MLIMSFLNNLLVLVTTSMSIRATRFVASSTLSFCSRPGYVYVVTEWPTMFVGVYVLATSVSVCGVTHRVLVTESSLSIHSLGPWILTRFLHPKIVLGLVALSIRFYI